MKEGRKGGSRGIRCRSWLCRGGMGLVGGFGGRFLGWCLRVELYGLARL